MRGTSTSFSYTFNNDTFKKLFGGGDSSSDKSGNQSASTDPNADPDGLNPDGEGEGENKESGGRLLGKKKETGETDADGYILLVRCIGKHDAVNDVIQCAVTAYYNNGAVAVVGKDTCQTLYRTEPFGLHIVVRHTFAVHVLDKLVKEGVDMHCCLPVLSMALGHKCVSDTEYYVRITNQVYPHLSDTTSAISEYVFPTISTMK